MTPLGFYLSLVDGTRLKDPWKLFCVANVAILMGLNHQNMVALSLLSYL